MFVLFVSVHVQAWVHARAPSGAFDRVDRPMCRRTVPKDPHTSIDIWRQGGKQGRREDAMAMSEDFGHSAIGSDPIFVDSKVATLKLCSRNDASESPFMSYHGAQDPPKLTLRKWIIMPCSRA